MEAKIGSAAYKLKLPPTSNVHPVFHVSLLKKVTGMTDIVPTPLPPEIPKLQIPEAALDRRVSTRSNRLHRQLLIKWTGLPPELATWEDEDDMLLRFPDVSAWGQAAAKGGGDVTDVGASQTQKDGPREKHNRKPNNKTSGPEWTK